MYLKQILWRPDELVKLQKLMHEMSRDFLKVREWWTQMLKMTKVVSKAPFWPTRESGMGHFNGLEVNAPISILRTIIFLYLLIPLNFFQLEK